MDRIELLLAVLLATGLLAAGWRAREGRIRTGLAVARQPSASGAPRAADIAAALRPTTPLAFVQFTAPDCAPCTRTHAVLEAAAAARPDVSVLAVDVGDALDLARAHHILRAPTTLLITAEGELLARVGGVPRAADLDALLATSTQ